MCVCVCVSEKKNFGEGREEEEEFFESEQLRRICIYRSEIFFFQTFFLFFFPDFSRRERKSLQRGGGSIKMYVQVLLERSFGTEPLFPLVIFIGADKTAGLIRIPLDVWRS